MNFILQMAERIQHSILPSLRTPVGAKRLVSILLCIAFCAPARPETVSAEYHRPISVELVTYLDVHHFHAGSTFFVKVVNDWTGLGCFFRNDQILEGKVVLSQLRGKGADTSQLAVSFDKVPCLYNKATIDLVLAAASFDAAANIPSSPFPIMHTSIGKQGSVGAIQRSFNIAGLEMAAMSGKGRERPRLKPGQVIGIKGVAIRMGEGPGKSSILESSTHDVWLDKEAVLVLVPASVAFLHPSSSNVEVALSPEDTPATEAGEEHPAENVALNVPVTAPVSPAPPREFLPCEPPACNVELPENGPEHLGKAVQSIAIRPLGYAPRPHREIGELDNDDSLVWLGSHQLMVAFNPHKLIPRDGSTASGATLRRIHAVVLDLPTQKIVSTADWDLPDTQPYLWQLSNNRVLVHLENELRILGEDMNVETRIPLDGPLAFVRTSPNGELMAVAVIHERHSPELHRRLRDALDRDPDEDVHIRILDNNFQTVAQATSSREIMPPIMLNEGQVRLLAAPEAKYRLEMLPWEGDAVTIARFTSGCLPSVSSFSPDLLFVATCSPQSRIHEYRVLRPNGAVVLHGKSDPQNLGQGVLGANHKFAVKVLHAKHAIVDGSTFHGADLDSAEIRIFRSEDGVHLITVHTELPPPTRGAFALSSNGAQLAVLSDAKITLFSLP